MKSWWTKDEGSIWVVLSNQCSKGASSTLTVTLVSVIVMQNLNNSWKVNSEKKIENKILKQIFDKNDFFTIIWEKRNHYIHHADQYFTQITKNQQQTDRHNEKPRTLILDKRNLHLKHIIECIINYKIKNENKPNIRLEFWEKKSDLLILPNKRFRVHTYEASIRRSHRNPRDNWINCIQMSFFWSSRLLGHSGIGRPKKK